MARACSQAPGAAAPLVHRPLLLAELRTQLLRLVMRRSSCQAGLLATDASGKAGRIPSCAAELPCATSRWAPLAGRGSLTWVGSAPRGGCGSAPQAPAAAAQPAPVHSDRAAELPCSPGTCANWLAAARSHGFARISLVAAAALPGHRRQRRDQVHGAVAAPRERLARRGAAHILGLAPCPRRGPRRGRAGRCLLHVAHQPSVKRL